MRLIIEIIHVADTKVLEFNIEKEQISNSVINVINIETNARIQMSNIIVAILRYYSIFN